jgi:hypothetical protein
MKNKILVITRGGIPYIKEVRQIAKSVTATILMQQLDYWFDKYPNGFYKFKSPCNHINYKQGDSWEEELFFSEEEFTTAFSKIGHSHKSKTEFDSSLDKFNNKFYCSYFDRKTCLTYYYRNHDLLDDELEKISTNRQSRNTETDNHGIQKPTITEPPYNITKTTQKITQNIKNNKKENEDFFNSFYQSYPKKINKPNAEKTFNKILSANKNNIPLFVEKITEGLNKYKELLSLKNTELQFTQNPQAWLNSCGWESIDTYQDEINQIKAKNNTNFHQNEQSYQDTQNNAPKPVLNDDKESDDYFAYRFNEDIYSGFGFKECNELTEYIEKQKPAYKKVARTLALVEWLKNKPNHELTQGIKKDIIDIYNSGGYDVFVKKAIKNNPNSNWVELLDLLNLK